MREPVLATQSDPAALGGAARASRSSRSRSPSGSLVFWVGHVQLLNQPVFLRGFLYGIFWGIPFTLLTLLATRSEQAKRYLREHPEEQRRSLTTPASCSRCSTPRDAQIGSAPRAACHADPSLIHPSVHVVVDDRRAAASGSSAATARTARPATGITPAAAT